MRDVGMQMSEHHKVFSESIDMRYVVCKNPPLKDIDNLDNTLIDLFSSRKRVHHPYFKPCEFFKDNIVSDSLKKVTSSLTSGVVKTTATSPLTKYGYIAKEVLR
jgi:hypothetical protein